MKNFRWPVRVYYEDTDAGGVVYHASYLRFYERARTERLRALGLEQDRLRAEHGLVFAVRSIQVDYLRPARFNDELVVSADVQDLRHASVDFRQEISRIHVDGGAELLSKSVVRVACLEFESFSPTIIPEFIRKRLDNDG